MAESADKALYPGSRGWRGATEAEGCPKFGQVSVMDRPRDYDGQPEASVRPGLIVPQVGSHSVVWWDPYKLHLGAEADYGMRQEDLLRDDGERRRRLTRSGRKRERPRLSRDRGLSSRCFCRARQLVAARASDGRRVCLHREGRTARRSDASERWSMRRCETWGCRQLKTRSSEW